MTTACGWPSGETKLVAGAFGLLPLTELPRFLSLADDLTIGFAEISRQFRDWIRTWPQNAHNA
jgi:hypothetical protein